MIDAFLRGATDAPRRPTDGAPDRMRDLRAVERRAPRIAERADAPTARDAARRTARRDATRDAGRSDRAERIDTPDRDEPRSERAATDAPPPFAALLAQAGQPPAALRTGALRFGDVPGASAEQDDAADAENGEAIGTAARDEPFGGAVREFARATSSAVRRAEPEPVAPPVIPGALARTLERKLAMLRAVLGADGAADGDATTSIDALLASAGTPQGRAIASLLDAVRDAKDAADAIAAGRARSAADVTTPVRDPDALVPALRTRLDRVIARMQAEHGHDVTIVETVRSAERQDHLFAQGRSAPGPVVTWTRHSMHESGRAADVMIDGGWNDAEAFATLQRIAAEEGLHTLGPRDPGHLELPADVSDLDATLPFAPVTAARAAAAAAGAREARRGGIAVPAAVAGVAAPAAVAATAAAAAVARVATVGSDGGRAVNDTARTATVAIDGAPGAPVAAGAAGVMSAARTGAGTAGDRDGAREREGSARDRARGGDDAIGGLADVARDARTLSAFESPRTPVRGGGVTATDALAPATVAERAEAVAALREDGPARAVSSLTLRMGEGDAAERIRVAVRGGAIDAQVTTSDASLADRLRLQTADLQDALGRRGLDGENVRLQTQRTDGELARAVVERGEQVRLAGAGAGAGTGGQSAPQDDPSARERWTPRSGDRDPRDPRDDADRRDRRDPRQEQPR